MTDHFFLFNKKIVDTSKQKTSSGTCVANFDQDFVLLSKIAKEKKYAQEYLGLLARRGDIGSIRIGKRWYTTWAWFEEFLENSQKKKEEVVVQNTEAKKSVELDSYPVEEKIEMKVASHPAVEKIPVILAEQKKLLISDEDKINIRPEINVPDSSYISVAAVAKNNNQTTNSNNEANDVEVKINVPQENKATPIRLQAEPKHEERIMIRKVMPAQRKAVPVQIRRPVLRTNIQAAKRVETNVPVRQNVAPAIARKIIQNEKPIAAEIKNDPVVASPDFAKGITDEPRRSIFSVLAYSTSFAIIILFLSASAYFGFSGNLPGEGRVAGASDSRNKGIEDIKSEGDFYLTGAGDKMKESFSISGAVIEAAKSRETKVEQATVQ